ncbi:MAG: discoidin domain-containing protein [Bryobacterales bacterium]|nr:discoidin domain-containing protein [Bryobacterales bacterium]
MTHTRLHHFLFRSSLLLSMTVPAAAPAVGSSAIEGPWIFTIGGYAHKVEFHQSVNGLTGSMEYGSGMDALRDLRYDSSSGSISFLRPLRAYGISDQNFRGTMEGTAGEGTLTDPGRSLKWTAARPSGYRPPDPVPSQGRPVSTAGLQGRISTSTGRDFVAGARILIGRLEFQDSSQPVDKLLVTSLAADTVTDENGNFIAVVPSGIYDVVVWKRGYTPRRDRGITVPGRYSATIGKDSMRTSAHMELQLLTSKPGPERSNQAVNLAFKRPASQSSLSEYSKPNDAKGGVDGVKNGGFGFHTNRENHPWWQVDLGAICRIEEVRIFNRTDFNPERASTLMIRFSDNGINWKTVYEHDGTNPGGIGNPLRVRLANGSGRYVRIELRSPNEYLHLDEVEVYGPPPANRS